jgi:hypothetical protein
VDGNEEAIPQSRGSLENAEGTQRVAGYWTHIQQKQPAENQ